nr:OmpA family protein [Treponemataceae bacterium]
DSYRILSNVHEDVFVNGKPHHHAEIINRIAVKVTGLTEDGQGIHEAQFMTSENSVVLGTTKTLFTWGEEYQSKFIRNKQGVYTITDEFFMPTVRDVPVFPDKDLQVGDTWQYQGHEAHDLRKSFGLEKPFKVPFTANYTYLGTSEKDGTTYHVIKSSYTLYYENPKVSKRENGIDYPVSTMGFSDQTLYWDNEKGLIQSYNEKFRIQIETEGGTVFVFKGTASAEVQEVEKVNNTATIEKVQDQIEELGIQDAEVKSDDKGITISLENIQFKPNSAELLDSEKIKLEKIAQILQAFPNNDLLVTGHTALSGSAESCQKLSEERAAAVADYLINKGTKDAHSIFTKGMGARQPIAPNSSTVGMARNRRVEITIMQ